MSHRIAKSLAAVTAIAALAVPVAQARQGADDPAGHERHAAHAVTAKGHHKARHRHRHGARHVRRDDDGALGQARGADDDAARGGGADDPAGHR